MPSEKHPKDTSKSGVYLSIIEAEGLNLQETLHSTPEFKENMKDFVSTTIHFLCLLDLCYWQGFPLPPLFNTLLHAIGETVSIVSEQVFCHPDLH